MQAVHQPYSAPGGSPVAPRSRRRRVLVITLSVAGALLLVIASLVVSLVLASGGSQPDQTAETDGQATIVGEAADPADDTAAVQTTEVLPDEPLAPAGNHNSGQEPADLLGGLSLFNLSGTSAEQKTVNGGQTAELDPATARQSLVDELATLGVTEAEVADFLAAYDLLVSEDFITAYEALTDEDKQAYETALEGVVEDYLESFLTDCDFSDLFSSEIESQEDLIACVIASFNQLGEDIVQVSQEHGLATTTETGE